jgi:hypothetical protein
LAPFFPISWALFIFIFSLKNLEEVWRWTWHFGRMGVQYPHYLKLAPTLGRVKSSILHGAWRFHFFPKKKIQNLEYTKTFISTVGIFVY